MGKIGREECVNKACSSFNKWCQLTRSKSSALVPVVNFNCQVEDLAHTGLQRDQNNWMFFTKLKANGQEAHLVLSVTYRLPIGRLAAIE